MSSRGPSRFIFVAPIRCGAFGGVEQEAPFLRMCAEHSRVLPISTPAVEIGGDEQVSGGGPAGNKRLRLKSRLPAARDFGRLCTTGNRNWPTCLKMASKAMQRTGPDQRVIWANKALLKLLGYTAEEFVGHHLRDFFVDAQSANEFWGRLMGREEVYDFPAEMRCKDGSIKHVSIQSNGLWDGDRFVHTRTFIHDVTERKQMELALRQAHDELEVRVAERTAELREKNEKISRQAELLDRTNRGLRELSVRLLHVQDDERRRIARDLHDGTGQALALLCMNLSALKAEARSVGFQAGSGVGREYRHRQADFHRSAHAVLSACIRRCWMRWGWSPLCAGTSTDSRNEVKFKFDWSFPRAGDAFAEDLEIAIFRVVQECLTNVHRHSGSATATIRLYESSGNAVLEVSDEGRGISCRKDVADLVGGSRGRGIARHSRANQGFRRGFGRYIGW